MKILILTSEPHVEFVEEQIEKNQSSEHSWIIGIESDMGFSTNYDVGISFMSIIKIPKEQLSKTWINFHPGPLPEYKGRNLCYHALMNGERQFGASIHYMDDGFDTGDIIDVWTFPIEDADTADSLSKITMQVSYDLFEEYLPRIVAGEQFTRIPNVGGNYYKKEPIDDVLSGVPYYLGLEIRAITYKEFYPKIKLGGKIYKVIPE